MLRRALLIWLAVFLLPGCNRAFYQPDRLVHFPPEERGYEAQRLNFASGDGTMLSA